MSRPVDPTDYVLGELGEQERAVAERLMREDPGFRAEVERLRPLVRSLEGLPAEAWEGVAPPAPPPPPPAPARSVGSRLRSLWAPRLVLRPVAVLGASLALIAAGAGIGALLSGDGDGAPEGARYALSPLGEAGTSARAQATVVGGDLRLELSGLDPSPAGGFHELWLLNSPADLVGIASFRVPDSGRTTITVPLPRDPGDYRFLDISVEPADGDPAHSGASVLRGETGPARS